MCREESIGPPKMIMETFPHPRLLLLLAQNLPPLTPFPSAANMRSLHTVASTHVQSRPWVSAPCVAFSGTTDAWLSLCPSGSLTLLPSCLPSLGAALLSALRAAPRRCAHYEDSDSCSAHPPPHLLRHTFLSFRLQPRRLPGHRFPPRQRVQRVSDFALVSQARRSSPPNRVRPPTDRHFASGCSPPRLAATQFPSASELVAFFDTDFHRADVAPSWAHSFRRTPESRHFLNLNESEPGCRRSPA